MRSLQLLKTELLSNLGNTSNWIASRGFEKGLPSHHIGSLCATFNQKSHFQETVKKLEYEFPCQVWTGFCKRLEDDILSFSEICEYIADRSKDLKYNSSESKTKPIKSYGKWFVVFSCIALTLCVVNWSQGRITR